MTDVVVDPDVFTKLSSAILAQIAQQMVQDPNPTRPKAKGKWLETVDLSDGRRYAVSCHKEGAKIVIIGAREAQKHGRRIKP